MSAHILAFQPTPATGNTTRTPEPGRHTPEGIPNLPDREWGLTAGQVVAIVLAIVAACEVFGLIV